MASSSMRNSFSAAHLLDPKAMKQQMANGNCSSHLTFPPENYLNRSSNESTAIPSLPAHTYVVSSNLLPPDAEGDAYELSKGANKLPSRSPKPPSSVNSARQLLDPKSFGNPNSSCSTMPASSKRSPSSEPTPTDSTSKLTVVHTTAAGPATEDADYGIGNHIERLHGVAERTDRPSKRQRLDEDEKGGNKAMFTSTIRKGGELGEYVKEKQTEGLQDPRHLVDLTGDDDEVVIVSENPVEDEGDKEVCYGRIDCTKVNAHQYPTPSSKAMSFKGNSHWPSMKLVLWRMPGKDNVIRVLDAVGKDFGLVDFRTSVGLARIMDSTGVKYRVQARLSSRKRSPWEYPGQACSVYLDMVINLYGPRNKAQQIGKWLSQKQIYLRTPQLSDANIEIHNPHQTQVLPRTSASGALRTNGAVVSTGYATRTVEEVRSDVIGMFDSLEKFKDLPEVEPDQRILTPLMSHQKQGLFFLQSKESARVLSENESDNNSLWRSKTAGNGRQSYYNIITGHEEREKPPEVLGGILADMMGLGKTLSILALIVGSLKDAKQFGRDPVTVTDGDKTIVRNSKTTLLVAPLSTLANWEDQIATHIVPDTLRWYIYHGPSRTQDVDELAKYDMVITTYSIVASDFGRKQQSPLVQTNFFRIVLDEAHTIRERSTRQSQAICALSAQRRWAVTGTPVQNRLEDLGSLIKFLRVKPFSDQGGFAQFILAPFKNADPDIIPKLRILVDSFTLRRLKDTIDLPGRHDHVVKLSFNEDERRLYEWFAQDSRNKLQIIASDKLRSLGGKSYAQVLRAIMRLRLICAHGRELLSEEDLRITEGFCREHAIDLESGDQRTSALGPRQAYEMLMLAQESGTNTCIACSKTVESRNDEDTHEVIGCMLPCYQLVCTDCMEGVKTSAIQQSSDEHFKCPYCEATLPTSFFELTREGMEEAEEARLAAQQDPRRAKVLGRYGGPHTKVKALLDGLLKSAKESEALPAGEQPIKNVVFSGWTSYLDLIQIALEEHKINFVRLDGKMSRKNRNAALEAFREDPEVCVIVISINAGGLGLNLTSGSRVYIMEPQFNPAAEAQAVDRVHRLGQTREVFISRFIMEKSFEEKVVDLQRRKQNLAELSMSRGKLDKAEAAKRKLDDLRTLFK